MIARDKFCEIINSIKTQHANEEKLTETINTLLMNGHSVVNINSVYESIILDLLALSFDTKNHDSIKTDLETYIYDYDFCQKESLYIMCDKQKHRIDSPSSLYDYFVKCYMKED